MGIESTVENWLAGVAFKKVSIHVINVAVSWILAHGATGFLEANGAHVDPVVLQNALTAAFTGALAALHDYVKLKTGWAWL